MTILSVEFDYLHVNVLFVSLDGAEKKIVYQSGRCRELSITDQV